MPEPTGLGGNRPPMYRPAATQPLDPAVAERATQQLKPSGQAKTTPLDPIEQDVRLPGLLGAVQGFVQSIFGKGVKTGAPASADNSGIALPQDGGNQGRLPESEPSKSAPAAMRDWSAIVSMDGGAAPAGVSGTTPATALPPESRPATRSWGMVSMDGAKPEEPQNSSQSAAPGMFRSWGMVSMAGDQKAPAGQSAEETPQVFRSWGMVDMREETPPEVEPPRRPDPPPAPGNGTVKVEPPPVAGGQGVTGAAREALIAKVKASLGPDAGLLDQLDAKGILDVLGPSGKTVLESLAEMTSVPLSEEAKKLGFSNASVLEQTVSDLADPASIQQQGENDCVWTNLRFFLSRDKQGEYVETAIALYRDGKVNIDGGGEVKLEKALEPFDLGGDAGKVWYQDGALWLQYEGFPPMSAERFVTGFLNNQAWLDDIFARNPKFDNPLIRGLVDQIKTMWNDGRRDEALQTLAPFIDLYIKLKPGEKTEGMKYALQNVRSLFKPAAQSSDALPKGVALGKVDDFLPGLKGFYADDNVLDYVNQGAARGAQIPVAFRTDDGEGLHLATVIGRSGDGQILIYDPEEGPRSIPESLLRERSVAVFAPPEFGEGLRMVPDTDTREVGGGRFGRRKVFG